MTSLSLIVAFLFAISLTINAASVTQDFTDAMDAAVQDLIVDSAWNQFYSKTMLFDVPTCMRNVSWPTRDPFVGRSSLRMCYETGTQSP